MCASWRTGAHIEKDHDVKQLISFMVFVTTEVFCINGVIMLGCSGGVVAHPGCLWVGCFWLWNICTMFCVICTCASSVQSSTMQQNIRATLIINFSHLNKASLTLCVPHHVCSAGSTSLSPLSPSLTLSLSLPVRRARPLSLFLILFNFYFFCSAHGAAPGEHYFQKASSCIIVRIHALISWTIWQTASAPSSLNALHLLIKWMPHCFQSNTLNLWASLHFNLLSETRFFMLQRLCRSFK